MTSGEAWGMMIGLGLALTAITVLLNFLERKFSDEEASSEKFNTAGRSVKTVEDSPLETEDLDAGKNTVAYEARLLKDLILRLA